MAEDRLERDAQLAAQMEADVGVEHVADVYAEAFLGAAESEGQTETLVAEFDSLVADVLDHHPELERILTSGLISHEEKTGILDRVFGGRASTVLLNFLKVVSRHGRLDCLRVIHRRTHELYDELQGRVRLRLATAAEISDELANRITSRLREIVDGEPLVERVTDPDLIGGAVVRVGDTVYDGSVATRLERMRQQMIKRSAHEIQSRRDRFRHPAGN